MGQPRLAFDQFTNSISIGFSKISLIFNCVANEVNANPLILSNSGSKVGGVCCGASRGVAVVNVGSDNKELPFVVHAAVIIDKIIPKKINASLFSAFKMNFTLVIWSTNIY